MAEPYQELDPQTRDRAVAVIRDWAVRQENRRRPFLEFLDGTQLTPMDLLIEQPPSEKVLAYRAPPVSLETLQILFRRLQLVLRPERPRAWTRVLNLVAVSAKDGEDDVNVLLEEIAGRAEAEGSTGVSTV